MLAIPFRDAMPKATSNAVASETVHGHQSRLRLSAPGLGFSEADTGASHLKIEKKSEEMQLRTKSLNGQNASQEITKPKAHQELLELTILDNPFAFLSCNEPAPASQSFHDDLCSTASPETNKKFPVFSRKSLESVLTPPVINLICSTELEHLSETDSSSILRQRQTPTDPINSNTSNRSSGRATAQNNPPLGSSVSDRLALSNPGYPDSKLSPEQRRSTTLAFLPKKPLLEPDRHPSTPPIHPNASNYFLSLGNSQPRQYDSPLQKIIPAESSSPARICRPKSNTDSMTSFHVTAARPTSPFSSNAYERTNTPPPPKRTAISSPQTQFLPSDELLGFTTRKMTPD